MEFTKVEMNALEAVIEDKKAEQTRELEALELALVGGGIGDIHF